jgi:hypothetical protein
MREREKRVTSATLLWTLAAAPRVTRAVAAQRRSISLRALHGRVELRLPPEGAIGVCSFCRPVLVAHCAVAARRTGTCNARIAGPFCGRERRRPDGSYIHACDSAGKPPPLRPASPAPQMASRRADGGLARRRFGLPGRACRLFVLGREEPTGAPSAGGARKADGSSSRASGRGRACRPGNAGRCADDICGSPGGSRISPGPQALRVSRRRRS